MSKGLLIRLPTYILCLNKIWRYLLKVKYGMLKPAQIEDKTYYSKPIKSKIPVGCREGDDIITALDGQVIIFPTARGLTAMAPQEFVTTTERTLSYLSDTIQEKYNRYYNDEVMNASLLPSATGYKSMIKIVTYKYWILLYRYMDREILALDTRNNSWWIWETALSNKVFTCP